MPPSGASLMPAAQQAVVIPQQPVVQQQPALPAQPTTVQPPAMAQQQMVQSPAVPAQQVVSMPAVIPVQSTMPNYNPNQPAPSVVTIAGGNNNLDQQTAALTADVDKLMSQLQTTYAQKINDYGNQTKALQDQVQTLSNKVANMESQLNQLVQLLTRQQGMLNSSAAPPQPVQPQIAELPRVAYNVQAIIPGRAWLKSDNGETLTVAEGDVIKEVGRVTKIDPYDGLVEINTGNKVISLSYGNGS
jgi:intracellular multiplication protein IcmG